MDLDSNLIDSLQWRAFNLSMKLLDFAYNDKYSKELREELLKHCNMAFGESQALLAVVGMDLDNQYLKAIRLQEELQAQLYGV